MSWNSVIDNATKQENEALEIAKAPELTIESFYPELHSSERTSERRGLFTNTSGSHLIADLLSSPRVVVDLYPFADECELIRIYGVDKKFLLELRDRDLVMLAANADLPRFRPSEWMHDILSDKRTLFRSIRTPMFFESLFPTILDEREEVKKYLKTRFERMTTSQVQNFLGQAQVRQENIDAEVLSAQLSWEWLRLEKLVAKTVEDSGEESGTTYSLEDVLSHPDPYLNIMYRDFHLAVSPHSAALGGSFRLKQSAIRKYFPENRSTGQLFGETEFIEEIHNYLLSLTAHLEISELTSEQYWNQLTPLKRDQLLDFLVQESDREDIMLTERNLRTRVALLDNTVSFEELRALVQRDVRFITKFEGIAKIGYQSATSIFGWYMDHYFGFSGGPAGTAGGVAIGEIAKSSLKKTLEFVFPRLQVVNLVKERQGG